MSCSTSSVARAFLVAVLLAAVGCGSKEVPGQGRVRPNAPDRADAGGEGSNPDDRCLVFNDDTKRGPGQACVCATDCTTGNCDQGVCCSGAACGAKRPEGAACSVATQCNSGFCADGVCCNVACTGACLACNQAESMGECAPVGAGAPDPHSLCRTDAPSTCGQSGVCNGQGGCAKYAPDTVCSAGACNAAGQFVPPSTCDGEGTCVGGVAISCSPSKCIGTECVRVCTSNDQCVAGKTCLGGSCGKFGPGQTCTMNSECDSAFCVDGVCCESACAGACQSCSNPATRGKCVPTAAGVADSGCAVQAASTCGTNGKCDGKGACAKYDNNTTCRGAKCDAAGNTGTMAAKCNNGTCPASTTRSCTPFKGCNGNNCLGTCGSDTQCAGGTVCNAGSCGKRENGGKCGKGGDCSSGNCVEGVCCNTACNGICKSCAIPGMQGTCTNVAAGAPDPNGKCNDDSCKNLCDGKGACRQEKTDAPCGPTPRKCNGKQLVESKCTAQGECTARPATTCPMDCNDTDGCVATPPMCAISCGPDQTCTTAGCVCSTGKPPKECGSTCVAANACCPGQCGACEKCTATGTCTADEGKDCALSGGGPGKCNAQGVCAAPVCKKCPEKGWQCGAGTECGMPLDCGACVAGFHCDSHLCLPDACVVKTCKDKGWVCGSSTECGMTEDCGKCDPGFHCDSHACVMDACVPKCDGKICGSNGCSTGGTCGPGCKSNETCSPSGTACLCNEPCGTKQCGEDACGNKCGAGCAKGQTCGANGMCGCQPGTCGSTCEVCKDSEMCSNDQCVCKAGGCGKSCEICKDSEMCSNDQCVCKPGGCGKSCEICKDNETCSNAGKCECKPMCDGKECGGDGCKGTCGPGCKDGEMCTAAGKCEAPPAPPATP
jgi:hypothetical protein